MMAGIKVLAAVALLLTPSFAAISWSASDEDSTRRLAISTVMSSNKTDPKCIVGGYDPVLPARVYVGGPCSELKGTTPTAKFRYVMMETLDFALEDAAGKEAAAMKHYGTDVNQVQDFTTHSEVGVSKSFHFKGAKIKHAALFASVNSYLIKGNFGFNKNEFVVGQDKTTKKYTKLEICVSQCCKKPGTTGCTCSSKCPATKIKVVVGQYKFSVLAAAYDDSESINGTAYVANATGNGWNRVVAENGKGTPKSLTGSLAVYQCIDFTGMKADTLTIKDTAGKATLYKTLKECDLEGTAACTKYSVASMTVSTTGWSGGYGFPLTYNTGEWKTTDGSTYTMTPGMTKTVKIQCVKPAAKNLVTFKISDNLAEAKKAKVILLKYSFDISGVDATSKSGGYMVYDPTVKTAVAGGAAGGAGGAAGAGLGKKATVGSGRVATMPSTIVAVLATVVMSFKM